MGIKNLNSVLKNYNIFPKFTVEHIKSSVVAVDFSLFLYRFIYNQNNPVECFLRQVILFLKNNILPVYVLDGEAPEEKYNILNKRAMKRFKISEELNQLLELKEKLIDEKSSPVKIGMLEQEILKLEKKCVHFSREIIQNILDFFNLCGIPVIQSQYESDWVLAKLNQYYLVDYVLSEDSDLLAFGARKILKNFSIKDETFLLYDREAILRTLELNQNEFVDMCILCGCDYAPKIKNMTCQKSFELIKEWKEIENLNINCNMENIYMARNIFMKEIDKNYINELDEKIDKKEFQYKKLEEYLENKIDKKYLIPIFIRSCKKFVHYKKTRRFSNK